VPQAAATGENAEIQPKYSEKNLFVHLVSSQREGQTRVEMTKSGSRLVTVFVNQPRENRNCGGGKKEEVA
jgi:hypothetical protein